VDAENKRISLGIKQLSDDPWPTISERFGAGVEPEGKVARLQDRGVVVDLGDDIEGFVPVSSSGVDDAERLEEHYATGDALALRVLESDAANRRIVLEVTEIPERKSQEEIETARIAAAEAAAAAAAAASAAEAESDDDDFRLRPGRKGEAADSAEGTPAPAAERAAEVQAQAAAEAADSGTEEASAEAEGEAEEAVAEAEEAPAAETGEAPEAEADDAPAADADDAEEAQKEEE
jgi:small subunit ribosomal protein S1